MNLSLIIGGIMANNKNNRTCIICGRSYRYCPTCGEDTGKPTWYAIFDGENCHDIYETCVAYRDKNITVKEAYEKMNKLDLSYLDSIVPATKAQIEEILNSQNTLNESKKEANNTYVKKNFK